MFSLRLTTFHKNATTYKILMIGDSKSLFIISRFHVDLSTLIKSNFYWWKKVL